MSEEAKDKNIISCISREGKIKNLKVIFVYKLGYPKFISEQNLKVS